MEKVLVTGANGFIGSFLVERLVKENFRVVCLVRKTSDLRWLKLLPVELCFGELTKPETLLSALKGVEIVYHVGAAKSDFTEEGYDKVNYTGTADLLEACRQAGSVKRFVYLSSLAVMGPNPGPEPWDEDSTCNPISFYGSSKLKGEGEVRKYNDHFSTTIIRPPAVYGPRDTDLLPFFKAVRSGFKPRLGRKDRFASMVYIEDLIEAIFLASLSEKASGKTYFACDSEYYSYAEIMDKISAVMQRKCREIIIPIPIFFFAAGLSTLLSRLRGKAGVFNIQRAVEITQRYWLCSPERIKKDLGFTAKTSLSEGIKKTVGWYFDNNYI